MTKSTGSYWDSIEQLKHQIQTADAVVIGVGAGLSTAAGFTYSGERFQKYFADFIGKYRFKDMYSGGFYPLKLWRNIGHIGRGISISIAIWTLIMAPIKCYLNL